MKNVVLIDITWEFARKKAQYYSILKSTESEFWQYHHKNFMHVKFKKH